MAAARVAAAWQCARDDRVAYDALGAATQREIADILAEHSQICSRGPLGFIDGELARCVPVHRPLVRRRPFSGRRLLFLSTHIGSIGGMAVPEARMPIRDHAEHAAQRAFACVDRWRLHDLVIRDSRCTMHCARHYDSTQVHDMCRITAADEVPTLAQVA